MLIVIGILLNVNAVIHAMDGDISSTEWMQFGGVYLLSIAVPHAIAAKHRADGWDKPAML